MKRVLVIAAAFILMAGIAGGSVAWAKAGVTPPPVDDGQLADNDWTPPLVVTGDNVELAVGETYTLILESNPTTGCMWLLAENSDEAVLELTDHEFIPPATTVPGAGGEEVWTFKALQKGKSVITLDYGQHWEGGMKFKTFFLTVVVK